MVDFTLLNVCKPKLNLNDLILILIMLWKFQNFYYQYNITGKTAILSALGKFISVSSEDDSVVARSVTASEPEYCHVRCSRSREVTTEVVPQEEQADLAEVEVNYV